MNIWVISRSYPLPTNRMRGSFELEQAELLAKHGHRVCFIAAVFHPIHKVKKWGNVSFEHNQVRVYTDSVPFFPERMHIHLKRFQGKVWDKLLAKVEAENGVPDIIHVHYPAMVSIADSVLSYREKGSKVVLTDHWSKTLNNDMDSFQKRQMLTYVEKADAVLCVSKPLKDAIEKITGTEKKVEIVPNVVSGIFHEQEQNASTNIFTFIVVGRLAPVKQIDKIVLAFADAFENDPKVKLVIVGGGNEKEKISKIIKDRALETRVILTGTLPRESVADEINKANALVCFSKYETFGVPIAEAWCCGKPVVISDAVGVVDKWDESLGEMIPTDDTEALKKAMISLYRNYEKYDPKQIRRYATDRCGEDAVYQRLLNIYTGLINP